MQVTLGEELPIEEGQCDWCGEPLPRVAKWGAQVRRGYTVNNVGIFCSSECGRRAKNEWDNWPPVTTNTSTTRTRGRD